LIHHVLNECSIFKFIQYVHLLCNYKEEKESQWAVIQKKTIILLTFLTKVF